MIIELLKKYLKEKGFVFKSNTGVLNTNFRTKIIINFQKSNIALGKFYINLGIVYCELSKEINISFKSVHLRARINSLIEDKSLSNIQFDNFEDDIEYERIKKLLYVKCLPILNFYSDINNLKQLCKNNEFELKYFWLCKITNEEFYEFILYGRVPDS
jgi:hypothetical protein